MGGTGKTGGGSPVGGGGVGMLTTGTGPTSGVEGACTGTCTCTGTSDEIDSCVPLSTTATSTSSVGFTTSSSRGALFRSVGHTAAFASSDARSSSFSTMLMTCSNGNPLSHDNLSSLRSLSSFAPSVATSGVDAVAVDDDAFVADEQTCCYCLAMCTMLHTRHTLSNAGVARLVERKGLVGRRRRHREKLHSY